MQLCNINAHPLTNSEKYCSKRQSELRELSDSLHGRITLNNQPATVCGIATDHPYVGTLGSRDYIEKPVTIMQIKRWAKSSGIIELNA